jgi:hypothetical protein
MQSQSRFSLIVAVLLLLVWCFESPVRERLEFSFRDDGEVLVKADVVFSNGGANQAVNDRLRSVRRDYLDLRDPWTRRFARLDAIHETYEWERFQGELSRVMRGARIERDRLGDLFYDTSVNVNYSERDGVGELVMFAGDSQRASREQQREFEEGLERFSRDLASYFRAMDRLYAYLERHPDRSAPVFSMLVGDGEDEDLDAEETDMLDAVGRATDRLTSIVTTEPTSAWTLEEISSRVNDPFPASVVIIPGGPVLEMEGFEQDDATGGIRVPAVSLWTAFEALSGRWLSPDPLVALARNARLNPTEEISPEAMAAEPRLSRPPADWTEVKNELDARLRTAGTYRAAWIVRRGGEVRR